MCFDRAARQALKLPSIIPLIGWQPHSRECGPVAKLRARPEYAHNPLDQRMIEGVQVPGNRVVVLRA
jgi:hypothetical protein